MAGAAEPTAHYDSVITVIGDCKHTENQNQFYFRAESLRTKGRLSVSNAVIH
jgi:hypothetical protein